MSTEISKIVLKRGPTNKAAVYVGPVGEVVVDTDLRSLRVQDNVTPGGVVLSKVGHLHQIADVEGLQLALDSKGTSVSPSFTGTPTAPTAAPGTNTTQLATTAFVQTAVSGQMSGNAATATKLATPRTIGLTGDASGSVSFDGSASVTIDVQVADDSHQHSFANLTGKPTTIGGYGITDAQPLDSDLTAVAGLSTLGLIARTSTGQAATRSIAVTGVGLSVSNADGIAGNPTVTSNATSLNTVSTLVSRDASGNFAAGTITAALSGNASTATKLATARTLSLSGDATGSASFDGSANAAIAVTLDAAAMLTKLKTVDGDGSGLDADTIDGVESAFLARVTAGGLLAPASGSLVLDCRDGAI